MVSIDDLTCGVTYEFASRAVSNFGVLSSVSTTISRLAPNNVTAPNAPTSINVLSPSSSAAVPPAYTSVGVQFFAALVTWTASTTKSVVGYQIGYSTSFGGTIVYETKIITEPFYYHYTLSTASEFISVRAVDRSGNVSASLSSSTNLNTVIKYPAGTISVQNTTDVQVTGIKTGNQSSTRQVNVRYESSEGFTPVGGSPTETITFSIANTGFSAKPDAGWIQCASNTNITGVYDFDNASNSSSVAYFALRTIDGTNVPTYFARFSISLVDYT